MSFLSPDQINEKHGASYKCRACRISTGLHWYRSTSCPVCSKPECIAKLDCEWAEMEEEMRRIDDDQTN